MTPVQSFKQRLISLRGVIFIFIIFFATSIYMLLQIDQIFQEFKENSIRNNMEWMANSVYYFCSFKFDIPSESSYSDNQIANRIAQAEAVEMIEDFYPH